MEGEAKLVQVAYKQPHSDNKELAVAHTQATAQVS